MEQIEKQWTISRRGFFGVSGCSGTILASAFAGSKRLCGNELQSGALQRRKQQAFDIRYDAARKYLCRDVTPDATNGDEKRYSDLRASFSKTLPHNDLGEVDTSAYERFVSTLDSGDPEKFEALTRAPEAVVKLNDPQAAYAFEMTGPDSHETRVAAPPAFASAEMAVEMGELYWQALSADVPFRAYESDSTVAAATNDLNHFSASIVPRSLGPVTPQNVFRGETRGDQIGPYLSQFFWLQIPYGIARIDQRFTFPARDQSFLTNYSEWLACQRGAAATRKLVFDSQPRYISSFRELAEFVHQDFSFQPYMNAALILLQMGQAALSATNPYIGSKTQFGDITFGSKNVLSMVAQAALCGQKCSYYHKWLVHRRLRPEVFGGRVENHLSGRKTYDIHSDLLISEAVGRVFSAYGSRLLPVAYPEGSPTHPSYPSAHAANAGACATILKGFFNEEFVIPNPVQAAEDGLVLEAWQGADLLVGNEINKLAANIAFGRDAAGVHYRSDSIHGLIAGEREAIGLLEDYSRTYNERFEGFVLTTFGGRKIKITNGETMYV